MTTAISSFPERKLRVFLKTAVLLLMMSISVSYVLGLPANTKAPWNKPSETNTINDFNGSLNLAFPLVNISGRGEGEFPLVLRVGQYKWKKYIFKFVNPGTFANSSFPSMFCNVMQDLYGPGYPIGCDMGGWTSQDPFLTFTTLALDKERDPGYGPGMLVGSTQVARTATCWTAQQSSGQITLNGSMPTVTRFTMSYMTPDGQVHELVDKATLGKFREDNRFNFNCFTLSTDPNVTFSRGNEFVSTDGSAMTFVSDWAFTYPDPVLMNAVNVESLTHPSGYMHFRDGSTSRIQEGLIQWTRDRNGNKTTFSYVDRKLTSATDSMGRQVTIEYDVNDVSPYGLCDRVTYKGSLGQSRILRISKSNMGNVLRADHTLKTPNQMWPGVECDGICSGNNDLFNPVVPSQLWFPNGRSYRFGYNSFAEVAKLELPTGGAFEFDHDYGSNVGTFQNSNPLIRQTKEKRTYLQSNSAGSLVSREIYDRVMNNGETIVTVDVRDAFSNLVARRKSYFHGAGFFFPVLFPSAPVWGLEYMNWKHGREYKTELFAADGTTILQRVENTFANKNVPWLTAAQQQNAPPLDPRLTDVTKTLVDTNQISKTSFTYDNFNNVVDTYEYDFGSGQPGVLLRRTHSDYLTTNPVNNIDYTAPGINLLSLPSQQWISSDADGNNKRSLRVYEYDNYTLDGPNCQNSYHCGLQHRSNVSGFDSTFGTSYTTRGNATGFTRTVFVNGSITGSIFSASQYDILGNIVRTIEPRSTAGNILATNIEYDDRFGLANGNARTNSAPGELGGSSTFAMPTKVTNALGHTTYTKFDYFLGLPVDSEDINAFVTSSYYDDPLDRPTQTRRAVGTLAENQTTFVYDDVNRSITTSSDRDLNNDNLIVSRIVHDGLGRVIQNRQYESSSNYIVVLSEYDALNRPVKTSSPFRPQSESAEWTEQAFDALGRIVSVKTPDNAVVSTAYSGNKATLTDQAGKSRRSITDALGRLTEVHEDPEVPGGPAELNYQTIYTYDVLDNLVKITQGSQQRLFMYDSLKRLIRSRNPEQGTHASLSLSDSLTENSDWSIGYQYDANGNLTQKTDPRGVISTYTYDALNRNTTILYRINGQPDPNTGDVEYLYDNAASGKGQLWKTYKWGTKSSHTAVGSYDPAGRITQFYNLFPDGQGGWLPGFEINRTYNLAGNVTSQSYPSDNSVTYSYDSAGRLSSFTGNLGDGVQRTYASSFNYNARNQTTQELFGTQTALYHKLQYNIRGQLWDVRVATGSDVNGSWDRGALQFFYESTLTHGASGPDNNGNVLKSSHYVPNDQQQALAIPHQFYSYDSLNRLKSTAEYFISDFQPLTQTSLQTYSYDRWGNRTINVAVPKTWGTGINNKEFTVDPNNTNRLLVPSGQSGVMSYDSAGNLINDTYTGAGSRIYDAENRIVSAAGNMGQTSLYTYNAAGQRVRRQVGTSPEEWYIYGIDGELLAEYPANGNTENPQKEYGYRNGQLLITAESSSTRTNLALASSGATATASSQYSGNYPASSTINGDRRGLNWNNGGGWNDATVNTHPDWLEINFNGSKTIDEINVITLQDNPATPAEPTESMTFTLYGLTGYSVQYWNGSAWTTVTGGTVSSNNKVWKKFTFTPITTTKIRVLTSSSPDAYSRITEVEAWGNEAPTPRTNFALGGTTSASSTYSANYPAVSTINGDRRGLNWNFGGGWNDATVNTHPDWLEIDFNGSKTIDEINVITLQDTPATPAEPTESMTFTLYGLTGYSVQYWNSSAWTTVPGGTVTGNNKVWKKFTFSPITTTKIRVLTSSSPDAYSRLTEVEAWGPSETGASGSIRWLVPDHLGTPRIIVDQTGSLAGIRRHDYLPFGEELFAGTGGRTAAMGYAADGIRQQFTSKERDVETGLDYFLARYYSSVQGRFTSPDEFSGGADQLFAFTATASANPTFYADLGLPQSLNKYHYALNNPLRYVDPDGHNPCCLLVHEESMRTFFEGAGDFGTGVLKTGANTWNGMGNFTKEFIGGTPIEPYQPTSKAEAAGMIIADRVSFFVGFLIGRPNVGGVVIAETKTTAMAAAQVGNATKPVSTLKPGPFATESIPARGPERIWNASEKAFAASPGRCHTCGTTTSGTKNGSWVLDHQPASKLNLSKATQELFKQCLPCSRRQGGEVLKELLKLAY